MAPETSKQWILDSRPKGLPTYSGDNANFKLIEKDLPSLGPNQVLLKTLFLSNDPAQRGWLSDDIPPERLYVPPVAIGGPMRARGIAEVVESSADNLKPGTVVSANVCWVDYAVFDAKEVQPLPPLPDGMSVSHYLGALGGTGITAYYGLVVIGEAKARQRIVVSGAAGATGSMVVQIAKHIVGMKEVIGIAGSDEKCKWVENLGADKCLNYKSPSFEEDLVKATEGYVDSYFDNVGGSILDAMLGRLRQGGVVIACGGIAGYNSSEPTILKNYMQIVTMRLQVRGFIVLDYLHKARETQQLFVQAMKDGKLKIGDENEQVVPTRFEEIPKTWLKLFEGGNTGKLVTKL